MKYNAGNWFGPIGWALIISGAELALAQVVLYLLAFLEPPVLLMWVTALAFGFGVGCLGGARAYSRTPKNSARGGWQTWLGAGLLVAGAGLTSFVLVYSGMTGLNEPILLQLLKPALIGFAMYFSGDGYFKMSRG